MCLSTLFCANDGGSFLNLRFENDVKTYGTETESLQDIEKAMFENDVKTYGTETEITDIEEYKCLRMMYKRMVLKQKNNNKKMEECLRMM